MAISRKDRIRAKRRTMRVRSRLTKGVVPRVAVFRSLKHIQGQIIDDMAQTTLVSCASFQLKDAKGDKKTKAYAVGQELAKRAKEKGIDRVIFDRGPYKYHGRVQAFAQGLREGGITV